MPQSIQLLIDTAANRAQIAGGLPHQFTRRWEAALLAFLLQADGASVSAQQCNAALAQRGQRQPLNRAQFQRLYDAIAAFLAEIASIHTQPRQRSTGPWALQIRQPVEVTVDGQPRSAAAPRNAWPYPAITVQTGNLGNLLAILSKLLVSDGFAFEGQWQHALDMLHPLAQSPLWHCLTPEAQNLIDLRRVKAHRGMGQFAQTRALLQTVTARPAQADLAAIEYARFLLCRIRYDQDPARQHRQLWNDTAQPPASHGAQDTRSLAEWHNLRALLVRRRIETLLAPRPDKKTAGDPQELHSLALRHYQAAIYHGLAASDIDHVQAYIANLGHHLQTWGRLWQWAADVTYVDVLRWQSLAMSCADKFDAGKNTAWEYIFFAESWLNNPIDLRQLDPASKLGLDCQGLLPDDDRFYTTAIARLRVIADPRQLAIMLVLRLRFVTKHMPAKARLRGSIRSELQQLLAAQPPEFTQARADEGYAPWLPMPRRKRRS
jgi:hypothetical protein